MPRRFRLVSSASQETFAERHGPVKTHVYMMEECMVGHGLEGCLEVLDIGLDNATTEADALFWHSAIALLLVEAEDLHEDIVPRSCWGPRPLCSDLLKSITVSDPREFAAGLKRETGIDPNDFDKSVARRAPRAKATRCAEPRAAPR
eukprot:1596281-Prymnesium_polylepis.1